MEAGSDHIFLGGYTLVELVVVLAIIGVCLVAGSFSLAKGLTTQESRGAAQTWQAAASWAQLGVIWDGGSARLNYDDGHAELVHDFSEFGGSLESSAAALPVTTNLARWQTGRGVSVAFGGQLGSPDGGGSLFFGDVGRFYHLVIRPESGLTVRSISASGAT
jgi:prepilin-type N-terminal cleavage/methylation domain-containing protein